MKKFPSENELLDCEETYIYNPEGKVTQIQTTTLDRVRTISFEYSGGNLIKKTVVITDR